MTSILIPTADDTACRRPVLHDRCPLVVLYVATDLRTILMPGQQAQVYARDLRQQDADRTRIYRRLDLVYYVWLCTQMAAAEQHHAAGRISAATIETARERLALCQLWIEQQYTAQQIRVATHSGTTTYQSPSQARAA